MGVGIGTCVLTEGLYIKSLQKFNKSCVIYVITWEGLGGDSFLCQIWKSFIFNEMGMII